MDRTIVVVLSTLFILMINFKKLEEIAFALLPRHRGQMRTFHVAGVYRRKRLVSLGFNKDITHPKIGEFKYHELAKVHAELSAVIKGGLENYKGHEIAVLRINRNDKVDYSCPCNGCKDMIKQLNFSRAYFSNKSGQWEELDLHNSTVEKEPNRFKCSKIKQFQNERQIL